MDNQVLQQPDGGDGFSQAAYAVHRTRDGSDVKGGFNEIGQRNSLGLRSIDRRLKCSQLGFVWFLYAGLFYGSCFNICY